MTDAARSDDFESRILAFEQAWQEGRPPDFSDYLPAFAFPIARRRVLEELVCLDLEYRWKRAAMGEGSGPWTLEDYVRQRPELGPWNELPVELIAEEYRVRCRFGDKPSPETVVSRFGERGEEIADLFRQVDRELEAESDDAPPPSLPVHFLTAPVHDAAGFDPRAPLSYGDYVLRRLIGAGRMGKVYLAWQRSLERPVAVKFLRKAFLHDPDAVARFLQEARTVARLQHPHLVGIHGLGRTPGGGYFFVMDWINGADLAYVLQRGPVSIFQAVRWTIEACLAIEEAHRHGIVHCDLKPGNLLLGRDGRIRVTDFGLARSWEDETRTDEGMEGTAPFMAPEQVSRHWGHVSPQTDVYGLGAVLYTLLTGHAPWTGRTLADVLAQVVSAIPSPSPDALRPGLPAAWGEICRRCLSKVPRQRFAAVGELREALEEELTAGEMVGL